MNIVLRPKVTSSVGFATNDGATVYCSRGRAPSCEPPDMYAGEYRSNDAGRRSANLSSATTSFASTIARCRQTLRPTDVFSWKFTSLPRRCAPFRYMLTAPPAPLLFCCAPAPPESDAIGPFTTSTRSIMKGSMKSPAPRPTGTTPSKAGSVPPMPRMENKPGWRTRSEVPPVSIPGTHLRRSFMSVGFFSRMKSSVSVSTTIGSFSGGTSVNVPPKTLSGRYLESADASTVTVPRSATDSTAFVVAAWPERTATKTAATAPAARHIFPALIIKPFIRLPASSNC